MPMYGFRCPTCGLEFEVSRKMSDAANPATCPMDGGMGERIFTAPVSLRSGRGESAPPPAPAPQRTGGWSHFGHSHGAGTGGHKH